MPVGVLSAVLLTQNKILTLVKYNVITSFILTLLTIAGVLISRTYAGPLLVQIYFPMLFLPVSLWLCFRNVPGKEFRLNMKNMIAMLKYAVPLGLAGMLGMIMLETNKIIVSMMCTTNEFANYVNGAIEVPLIGIITISISSVILVDMTHYVQQGEKVKALELFKKASLKAAVVIFPVMVFLLVVGRSFIVTLFSIKYLDSVTPFYIYLFILPTRIVIFGSALMALGQSKVILLRTIFDLIINVILSIILVNFWGYLGAAIATIMTLYLWTVPYNLYKIGLGFQVNPLKTLPFKNLGFILIISVITLPILMFNLLLPKDAYFYKLILSGFLYFPLTGFLLIKFKLLEIPSQYYMYLPHFITSRWIKQ